MDDWLIRVLSAIAYPFYRWRHRAPPEWIDPWTERQPFRVLPAAGITFSGDAVDVQGHSKQGDVVWIEAGMGEMLVERGELEPVEQIGEPSHL